jgi:Protein of unknown function (DUF3800)
MAKILFLDESGDHNLAIIDPQYPLFVLGGVIIEQIYAEGQLEGELRQFKRKPMQSYCTRQIWFAIEVISNG